MPPSAPVVLVSLCVLASGCGYHDLAVTIRDPSRVRVQVTEATTDSFSSAVRGEFERRTVLDADLDTPEPRVATEEPTEVSRVMGIPIIRTGYEVTLSGDFTGDFTLHLVTRASSHTQLLSPDNQLIVPEMFLAPSNNTAWRGWPGRGVTLERGTLGIHRTPIMPAEVQLELGWRHRNQEVSPTLLVSLYTPVDNIVRVERISGFPPEERMQRALFGGVAIAFFLFTGASALGAAYSWNFAPPLSVGFAVVSAGLLTFAIYAAKQALGRRRTRPSSIEEIVDRHRPRSYREAGEAP